MVYLDVDQGFSILQTLCSIPSTKPRRMGQRKRQKRRRSKRRRRRTRIRNRKERIE
jgi:hypothetical protein